LLNGNNSDALILSDSLWHSQVRFSIYCSQSVTGHNEFFEIIL